MPNVGSGPGDRSERRGSPDHQYDIHIARDGTWYHEGSPIRRPELVRLFSRVLKRGEDGSYWLETPAERGRITVEDVPFLAVSMAIRHQGQDNQELVFTTNVGEEVVADRDHSLKVIGGNDTTGPTPYIEVRPGIDARLTRSVYYELVALAEDQPVEGGVCLRIHSRGVPFTIGTVRV